MTSGSTLRWSVSLSRQASACSRLASSLAWRLAPWPWPLPAEIVDRSDPGMITGIMRSNRSSKCRKRDVAAGVLGLDEKNSTSWLVTRPKFFVDGLQRSTTASHSVEPLAAGSWRGAAGTEPLANHPCADEIQLVEPGARHGLHVIVRDGHEPLAGIHRDAVGVPILSLNRRRPVVFSNQYNGQKRNVAVVHWPSSAGAPDPFMHGPAPGPGVEHLAGEQAHAAGHVLPEHVGRLKSLVEFSGTSSAAWRVPPTRLPWRRPRRSPGTPCARPNPSACHPRPGSCRRAAAWRPRSAQWSGARGRAHPTPGHPVRELPAAGLNRPSMDTRTRSADTFWRGDGGKMGFSGGHAIGWGWVWNARCNAFQTVFRNVGTRRGVVSSIGHVWIPPANKRGPISQKLGSWLILPSAVVSFRPGLVETVGARPGRR